MSVWNPNPTGKNGHRTGRNQYSKQTTTRTVIERALASYDPIPRKGSSNLPGRSVTMCLHLRPELYGALKQEAANRGVTMASLVEWGIATILGGDTRLPPSQYIGREKLAAKRKRMRAQIEEYTRLYHEAVARGETEPDRAADRAWHEKYDPKDAFQF